ncbi:hypothetical protein [Streptomyces cyaneofuscatus]|uniref:hypothetical protein n=1 Tax=Streptomyces cyaneofuscatus TaxID=66883 RepID=UPI0038299B17
MWSEAALMVLLAVLVHLLGCAHGPALSGEERADSIAAVFGPSCSQPPPPLTYPPGQAPAGDSDVHCQSGDEPSVQVPRALEQADVVQYDGIPVARDAAAVGHPSQRPPPPCSASVSAQQKRACLGVWRT